MSNHVNSFDHLLLMFDRPSEPTFMFKGKTKIMFDLPDNYLTERYKPIGQTLIDRFGEDADERVAVRAIKLPDLSLPLQLSRWAKFSLFLPWHRSMAGRLIDVFMEMGTLAELQSAALYARERINPQMFHYALSVVLLHREDTQGLQLPPFVRSFPGKFLDCTVFRKAREVAAVVPEKHRRPILIPKDFTASDLETEHRLAYFREDIGLNLHHWHWHLVYPHGASDRRLVDKDRRGELFYYMHQQILARYNMERLCNKLSRVKHFADFRQPIATGYFPKLDSVDASRAWPPRQDDRIFQDIDREADQIKVQLSDLERWRDRLYQAIHQGFVINHDGTQTTLTEEKGTDMLGNMIESSILSPNPDFYGDLHNMGHVFASYIHDPDNAKLESFGVMGDVTTAMRDPFFYQWHAFINDVFEEFKSTLPRYSVARLTFDGVTVTDVQVGQKNVLNTFWQQSDVDLSRGLDFMPQGNVYARFTHLQHRPFEYRIQINNKGKERKGTMRIFLAPKYDERGLSWMLRDQRRMFMEMDRFAITMREGYSTIVRKSSESSVTIPFERTYRNLDRDRPAAGTNEAREFNYCGCGWPDNLLVSKGTSEGTPCELFVMVSDFEKDKVDQGKRPASVCSNAVSYCGIRDKLYPDRQPMGFPFDRPPLTGVETLQQFLRPNMRVQDVKLKFDDVTEVNPKNSSNNAPKSS